MDASHYTTLHYLMNITENHNNTFAYELDEDENKLYITFSEEEIPSETFEEVRNTIKNPNSDVDVVNKHTSTPIPCHTEGKKLKAENV